MVSVSGIVMMVCVSYMIRVLVPGPLGVGSIMTRLVSRIRFLLAWVLGSYYIAEFITIKPKKQVLFFRGVAEQPR